MLVRRTQVHTTQAHNVLGSRNNRYKLEYLYARRSAIDALIESLEQYAQCRARRLASLSVKPS